MCGIVGVAGSSLSAKDEKAFEDMLIMDTVRGKDGLGIVAVDGGMNVQTLKRLLSAQEFLELAAYQNITSFHNRCLIGHNRAASVGKITPKNNHPFSHGTIHGVHNGTLWSMYSGLEKSAFFDVDSECLIYNISKRGVKETWEDVSGSAALAWWDEEGNTLNFIRNKERPLFGAYNEDKTVLYWSSEPFILRAATERNGIKTKDYFSFKEDHHYCFNIANTAYNAVKKEYASEEIAAPEVVDCVPFYPAISTGGASPHQEGVTGLFDVGSEIYFFLTGKKNVNEMFYAEGKVSSNPVFQRDVRVFFSGKTSYDAFKVDPNKIHKGTIGSILPQVDKKDKTSFIILIREEEIFGEADSPMPSDHLGVPIPEDAFMSRYVCCEKCEKLLNYEDKNEYLDHSTALCPLCSEKKEKANGNIH